MLAAGCTGLDALNPVCQVGSIGGSIAASGFESVLNGISQWVASGAEWLLGQIGDVLVSTTTVDVGATWFRAHYGQMTALAGVVILPMLLASTLQAVVRQNAGQLVRTFLVQLPLALLLAAVAIQVVVLSLSVTDAMSTAVAGGSGADVSSLLTAVTTGLVAAAADPTIASFVLLLIALLVAVAAFVLWIELLIRAAAVYVAVLFLPLALATLVWPAVSHWCRRLVETLAALILSKFVIVATLSLAAGAVSSGTAGDGRPWRRVLRRAGRRRAPRHGHVRPLRHPAPDPGGRGRCRRPSRRAARARDGRRDAAAPVRGGPRANEGLEALGDARLLAQTASAVGRAATGGDGLRGGGGAGNEGAGRAEGARTRRAGRGRDPDSMRAYDDAVSAGVVRRLAQGTQADPAVGTRRRTRRRRADGRRTVGLPAPTGPATPEDAWKWEGVPPGRSLIGKVEAGQLRYYMDDDGHGPRIVGLPPAWPPGRAPADAG